MLAPTQDGRATDDPVQAIRSVDGTPIGFARTGSGPKLLLVHGTTSGHDRWQPVLPTFSDRFSVFAMERRGRGLSGDGAAYAIAREIEDVAALAEAIGGPVDVVAHSFGAICALEAARRSAAIARLVLYEPPVPVPALNLSTNETEVDAIEAAVAQGDHEGALLRFYQDVLRAPAAEIARMQAQESWPQRVAMAHTVPRELRAVRRYRFDPAGFAAFDRPVLLLLGADSAPRYRAATEMLAGALRRSRIVELPGQQHNAINMAPALFAGEVMRFLES